MAGVGERGERDGHPAKDVVIAPDDFARRPGGTGRADQSPRQAGCRGPPPGPAAQRRWRPGSATSSAMSSTTWVVRRPPGRAPTKPPRRRCLAATARRTKKVAVGLGPPGRRAAGGTFPVIDVRAPIAGWLSTLLSRFVLRRF